MLICFLWAAPLCVARTASGPGAPRAVHALKGDAQLSFGHGNLKQWLRSRTAKWYARLLVFWLSGRGPFYSIVYDEWAALRAVDRAMSANNVAAAIRRRRQRGVKVQSIVGIGYTPRIIALAGLMLRSLHLSTALPTIWDPSLGLGAGACLAARWAQREWLACMMVGWYMGGLYWRALGVAPPPNFGGVPVVVRQVRL